jgi:hypothetical protein
MILIQWCLTFIGCKIFVRVRQGVVVVNSCSMLFKIVINLGFLQGFSRQTTSFGFHVCLIFFLCETNQVFERLRVFVDVPKNSGGKWTAVRVLNL